MYLSTLLVALVSYRGVVALPAPEKTYPEVIPGPGLPTLAELGLTSTDLYMMKPNLTHLPLAIRAKLFDAECGPDDGAYTDVNDIIACYNYLNGLGGQTCAVPDNEVVIQMVSAGSGQVIGQGPYGASSSDCSDVANAVLWVINDCTRPDQSVAGFQAAYGNGNLIVGAVNTDY